MIFKYNGPDDIDMLVNMCDRLPWLHVCVFFGSHKRFAESSEEISELIEFASFRANCIARVVRNYDSVNVEFENGSFILVTVAKESVRGRRAHIVAYDPDIDNGLICGIIERCATWHYNQLRIEGVKYENQRPH